MAKKAVRISRALHLIQRTLDAVALLLQQWAERSGIYRWIHRRIPERADPRSVETSGSTPVPPPSPAGDRTDDDAHPQR
jgi:hypothetical protein